MQILHWITSYIVVGIVCSRALMLESASRAMFDDVYLLPEGAKGEKIRIKIEKLREAKAGAWKSAGRACRCLAVG